MQRLESGSWREAEQGESQTGQDLDRRSRTIPGAQPIRLMLEDDDEMSAPGEMLTQPAEHLVLETLDIDLDDVREERRPLRSGHRRPAP